MVEEITRRVLGDMALWLLLALGLGLLWHAAVTLFMRRELSTAPLPGLLREEAELWKDLPPDWEEQAFAAERPARPGTPCDVYDLGVALVLLALLVLPFALFAAGADPSVAAPEAGREAASAAKVLSAQEVIAGIGQSLLLVAVLAVYLTGRRRSLREWFGLRPFSPPEAAVFVGKAALWTLAGGLAVYGLAEVLQRRLWLPLEIETGPQEIVETVARAGSWTARFWLAFSACLIAPVAEELVFRGFLYPVCRRFTSAVFATLLTGLVFGLVHANLHGILPLGLFGVILTLAYERERSLALPIAIHMLFNATTLFMLWVFGHTPAAP